MFFIHFFLPSRSKQTRFPFEKIAQTTLPFVAAVDTASPASGSVLGKTAGSPGISEADPVHNIFPDFLSMQ